MGDVLTKEERDALVQQVEQHLIYLHVDSFATNHSLKKCGVWNMLRDDYDHLVSEVARLRARNEALEKVAQAAAGPYGERPWWCERIDDEVHWARCEALRAALSALNPSETPNSSVGAP